MTKVNIFKELKNLIKTDAVYKNYDLTNHNTYRLSCVAKTCVIVNTLETFVKTMVICDKYSIKPKIIGKGSNVIIANNIVEDVVLIFGDKFANIYNIKNYVIAESGAGLSSVISYAKKLGLGGMESLVGIPASVGGAVVMNASAFGVSTFDFVSSVLVYRNGRIMTLNKEQIEYGYRYCEFQNDDTIVLRVEFDLRKIKKEDIEKNIIYFANERAKKNQSKYPNAGSVFKNGNNYFAGELIDKCGLKNYNIGNAYISSEHANFIENRSGATADDIISLIDYTKKRVKETFDIELELEQKIIK